MEDRRFATQLDRELGQGSQVSIDMVRSLSDRSVILCVADEDWGGCGRRRRTTRGCKGMSERRQVEQE